ncbi:Transcription factor ILR3-like protein [Drosera capensis]
MSSLPDETTITTCGPSSSKACREKLHTTFHIRSILFQVVSTLFQVRFVELGSILEPGRPPKTDKAAVLSDAVPIAEKNELRDEKQRLKAEKGRLELQLKSRSALPGFLPPPPAGITAFAPQAPPSGAKLVPLVSYAAVAMWQFMPPAAVD